MQVNAIQSTMPAFGAALKSSEAVTEQVSPKALNNGLDHDVVEIQSKKSNDLSLMEKLTVGTAAFAGPIAFCVGMTRLFMLFATKL